MIKLLWTLFKIGLFFYLGWKAKDWLEQLAEDAYENHLSTRKS